MRQMDLSFEFYALFLSKSSRSRKVSKLSKTDYADPRKTFLFCAMKNAAVGLKSER